MKKSLLAPLLFLVLSGCKKEPNIPQGPVTSVGETYQGGIVYYVDGTGQHGLVMSPNDLGTCFWTNEQGPSANFKRIITPEFEASLGQSGPDYGIRIGDLYTKRIVDTLGAGSYAAKICRDLELGGYSDWYLPTYQELILFYSIPSDKKPLFNGNGQVFYWSSTDDQNQTALAYNIFGGGQLSSYSFPKKTSNNNVRAVRKF